MKNYIAEIISAFSKFPEISAIHLEPGSDSVTAKAVGKERVVVIKAVGPAIPALTAPICLGNLKYLSKILSTEQIKGDHGSTTLTTGESINKEPIVRYIDFTGPRLKIRYEATDPKAGNLESVPDLAQQEWAGSLKIEPTVVREFNDALALQQVMNPSKNYFKIVADGGNAQFVFETGAGNSDKDITLTAGSYEGDLGETSYIHSGRFRAALSLAADGEDAKISLSRKVTRLEFTKDGIEYQVVMPKLMAPTR